MQILATDIQYLSVFNTKQPKTFTQSQPTAEQLGRGRTPRCSEFVINKTTESICKPTGIDIWLALQETHTSGFEHIHEAHKHTHTPRRNRLSVETESTSWLLGNPSLFSHRSHGKLAHCNKDETMGKEIILKRCTPGGARHTCTRVRTPTHTLWKPFQVCHQ